MSGRHSVLSPLEGRRVKLISRVPGTVLMGLPKASDVIDDVLCRVWKRLIAAEGVLPLTWAVLVLATVLV